MCPDTSYVSLGVSPNADGIVMQPVHFGVVYRPSFAFIIAFADLENRGRAAAIDLIGSVLMRCMTGYFPIINIFAEELILQQVKPLTVHIPDHSGNKREPHLRVHAINEDRSVVIRRFNNDDACGNGAPPVMLEPLMAVGPEAVADFFGTTLFAELAALHPDVFSQFPSLMEKRPG